MKKVKSMITYFVILSLFLTVLPFAASATEQSISDNVNYINETNLNAALFYGGNITAIKNWNDQIIDFSLAIDGRKAILEFRSVELEQNFEICVELTQITNLDGTGLEWIGTATEEQDDYTLVCFRIEENANSITLMEPNLWMEGGDVLNVAVQVCDTGDICYFQTVINAQSLGLHLVTDDLSIEEYSRVLDIREQYYQLKNHSNSALPVNEDVKYSSNVFLPDNDSGVMSGNLSDYLNTLPTYSSNSINASTYSMINNIDDEIFKSGTFDVIRTGTALGGAQFYYYVAHNFAGTGNRENHIMVFEWIRSSPQSQDYINQISVLNNACIHYNIYTDQVLLNSDHPNPAKVSNVSIKTSVINYDSGVIIKRQQRASISESTYQKIAKCIVSWIPYLSTIVDNYETLTGTPANEVKAYQPTYDLQKSIYGYTIWSVEVTTSRMATVGDYIFLEVWGSGVSGVNRYRTMTFSD